MWKNKNKKPGTYQTVEMISEKMIDMKRRKINFNFPMDGVSNKGNRTNTQVR